MDSITSDRPPASGLHGQRNLPSPRAYFVYFETRRPARREIIASRGEPLISFTAADMTIARTERAGGPRVRFRQGRSAN